jgi:hypothetical protein
MDFQYDCPSTYPNWLLTVSLPCLIDYIILNTPVNIVHTSQFKSCVHIGPNISIPFDIQQQLSVGMNYMFKKKSNSKLIKDSWNDFKERLRWCLFFSFTSEPNSEFTIQTTRYLIPKNGNPLIFRNILNMASLRAEPSLFHWCSQYLRKKLRTLLNHSLLNLA